MMDLLWSDARGSGGRRHFMARGGTRVFVWVFHRISGVLLIFLIAFQVCTGLFQASASNSDLVKTTADLHRHVAVNCLLVFFFIFHALYGVRTIALDLGARCEKLIFWICTIAGLVLFALFLVFFLPLVRA
jgi:succinate dehydrogenase cytochrome b556 subunit